MRIRLTAAREAFAEVVEFVVRHGASEPNVVYAGSVPFLMLAGATVAGWQMARALIKAEEQVAVGNDVDFMRAKVATARFYGDHILSLTAGWRDIAINGAPSLLAMPFDAYWFVTSQLLIVGATYGTSCRSAEPRSSRHRFTDVHHKHTSVGYRAMQRGYSRHHAGPQCAHRLATG